MCSDHARLNREWNALKGALKSSSQQLQTHLLLKLQERFRAAKEHTWRELTLKATNSPGSEAAAKLIR